MVTTEFKINKCSFSKIIYIVVLLSQSKLKCNEVNQRVNKKLILVNMENLIKVLSK